jgi:protein-S-isoprenylcysteine O-methyltransferase Ste14
MKIGKPITGIGIIVTIFGVVFFLQGHSVVGPKSSFMYSNPQWITNGQWIAAIGIIIFVAGLLIWKTSSQFPKS